MLHKKKKAPVKCAAGQGVTSEPLDKRAERVGSAGGEAQAQQLPCAAGTAANPSSSAEGGARARLAGWEASPVLLTRCFQPLKSKCQIPLHVSLALIFSNSAVVPADFGSMLGIVLESLTGRILTHG